MFKRNRRALKRLTKRISVFVLFVALILSFSSMPAFAGENGLSMVNKGFTDIPAQTIGGHEEDDDYTDSVDMLGWSSKDLIKIVEYNEAFVFPAPVTSITDLETVYDIMDINVLGSLVLKTGFSRSRMATFSAVKALAGTGEYGTIVGINVFHVDQTLDDTTGAKIKIIVPTQRSLKTIGLSGLYSGTISLDYIGVNYMLLAVKNPDDDNVYYRLFKITRKKEETKAILENLQVDFFNQEEETDGTDGLLPDFAELPL